MAYASVEQRNEVNRLRYHKLKETTPFRHKCFYIKSAARREQLSFDLTPDYLEDIWTGTCAISGQPIHLYNHRNDEWHAELDRTIPDKGYTQGNVAWTSRKFNRFKGNATIEELQQVIDYLSRIRKEYG
jgi:hypothetical protein